MPTYLAKWKQDYPNLKVSRPIEEICKSLVFGYDDKADGADGAVM